MNIHTEKQETILDVEKPSIYDYAEAVSLHVSDRQNKLHLETQGIRPVPEDQRTHTRILDNFTIWCSIDTTLANVSIGVLAIPVFGLGFWDSFACILICNVIAVLPGAFFVSLGPRYGLRQMVLSRYSFGMLGCILAAVVNIIVCLGWSVINVILAGQLLATVSDNKLPMYGGIILVAAVTLAITVFGYKVLHHFERWAWIVMWIAFFIVFGLGVKHMRVTPTSETGATEAGAFLSFAASIIGFNPGWVTCAADYSVNMPSTFDRRIVFTLAFLGAFLPCVLLQTLGVGLTTAISANAAWSLAYDTNGVGGLVGQAVSPVGAFGKFLLVILACGIITCNVPNNYSASLSVQTIAPLFQRVPQWFFTILATIVYTVAACVGAEHFAELLENFMLLIAYYCGPYAMILILEHNVFRRGVYPVESWNSAKELPVGVAAVSGIVVGFGGALLGMNQSWFVGPISKRIGQYGGDVGFELAIVFGSVTFLGLRYLERRIFGR
ncbi:permease for cytosine/purines uracil thiamine allantoin [Syncephalastrum racemosum]|uniref:Permease for cytosine/purines uracil thiamine allantoin n=1 Tax=Syncephalastrum racemosum TaxID=13706 RepID=A0A1X2HVE8_SYNRA|nr:permease for cytosine/purines uracil thiamine allantoin [Syncephalastrum racemosum]